MIAQPTIVINSLTAQIEKLKGQLKAEVSDLKAEKEAQKTVGDDLKQRLV